MLAASWAMDEALDDHAAGAADLVRKLAQAQEALPGADAVELHKLGLIKTKGNARP